MPGLTLTGKEGAPRAASLVPFRLLEPHPAVVVGLVGDPEAAKGNLLKHGNTPEAPKALLPRVRQTFHNLVPTGVAYYMLANGSMSSNQSDNGETHTMHTAGHGRLVHA